MKQGNKIIMETPVTAVKTILTCLGHIQLILAIRWRHCELPVTGAMYTGLAASSISSGSGEAARYEVKVITSAGHKRAHVRIRWQQGGLARKKINGEFLKDWKIGVKS